MAPSARDFERANELFARARRHLARGEMELAADRLRDAVGANPAMVDALVELGGTLYALEELEESAGAFEQAIVQAPGSREATIGLARTLVRQKKFAEAQEKLHQVVDAHPQDAESWLHLGDIAVYRGDEVAARQCYVKANQLAADDAATSKRAQQRLDALPSLTRQFSQDAATEGLAGR
jgi:cytochrome c-type biogenesis protein CcmH/NrfG